MVDINDYFSRSRFDKLSHQDHAANDKLVGLHGRYVGVLTKPQAETICRHVELLDFKKAQFENLMEEFNLLLAEYDEMAESALRFLEVGNCSIETHDLLVDSKRHCWVVLKSDLENTKEEYKYEGPFKPRII
jgi:hypothetical protein